MLAVFLIRLLVSMADILIFLNTIGVGVVTKTHFRIVGGIIILFVLFVCGENNIGGIPLLLGTVGVALLIELVFVKNFATDRDKPSQP